MRCDLCLEDKGSSFIYDRGKPAGRACDDCGRRMWAECARPGMFKPAAAPKPPETWTCDLCGAVKSSGVDMAWPVSGNPALKQCVSCRTRRYYTGEFKTAERKEQAPWRCWLCETVRDTAASQWTYVDGSRVCVPCRDRAFQHGLEKKGTAGMFKTAPALTWTCIQCGMYQGRSMVLHTMAGTNHAMCVSCASNQQYRLVRDEKNAAQDENAKLKAEVEKLKRHHAKHRDWLAQMLAEVEDAS